MKNGTSSKPNSSSRESELRRPTGSPGHQDDVPVHNIFEANNYRPQHQAEPTVATLPSTAGYGKGTSTFQAESTTYDFRNFYEQSIGDTVDGNPKEAKEKDRSFDSCQPASTRK